MAINFYNRPIITPVPVFRPRNKVPLEEDVSCSNRKIDISTAPEEFRSLEYAENLIALIDAWEEENTAAEWPHPEVIGPAHRTRPLLECGKIDTTTVSGFHTIGTTPFYRRIYK